MSGVKKPLFDLSKTPVWTVSQLEQLALEYPYFSTVHWLRAKNLYETSGNPSLPVVERAFLHTTNPMILDLFLQSSQIDGTSPAVILQVESPEILNQFQNNSSHTDFGDTASEVENINESVSSPLLNGEATNLFPIVEESLGNADEEESLDFSENIFQKNDALTDLVQQVTGKHKPGLQNEEEELTKIAFEPYHAVDYFASQGILVKDEAPTPNTFDTQLKSFTEWLKVFKKMPAGSVVSNMTEVQEKVVMENAGRSVHETEIVTEAMAEVWIRQGHYEKARNIYQKLSLLNPDKSSYFASQIENLKQRRP